MSSIGSYTISPFINNRSVLSACGQGCVDSLEQFQVATFTSGVTGTIGLSIQATLTPPLTTANPADIKTMQLWVDNLRTENCDFSITTPNLTLDATTGELSLTSETLIDINNGGSIGSTINIESDTNITLTSNTGSIILDSNTALNGTLTLDDIPALRSVTISPSLISVNDNVNAPFGDPIYTHIEPNSISMQNGNGSNQMLSMSSTLINLTSDILANTLNIDATSVSADSALTLKSISGSIILDSDTSLNGTLTLDNTLGVTNILTPLNIELTNTGSGLTNIINASSITVRDSSLTQINTITKTSILLQDTNLGLATTMNADSITSGNWAMDATGQGIFDTLTVASIAFVTTLSLSGTTLNIPLGGHAIDKSWAITLNNNVTVLNPTAGINGGVYKLWLTVGATPRTFSKACGVINNLLGDTVMAAGSVWLIEIYRRAASTYRAIFTNFT